MLLFGMCSGLFVDGWYFLGVFKRETSTNSFVFHWLILVPPSKSFGFWGRRTVFAVAPLLPSVCVWSLQLPGPYIESFPRTCKNFSLSPLFGPLCGTIVFFWGDFCEVSRSNHACSLIFSQSQVACCLAEGFLKPEVDRPFLPLAVLSPYHFGSFEFSLLSRLGP